MAQVYVISPMPAVRAGLYAMLQASADHEVVGQGTSISSLDSLLEAQLPVVIIAPETEDEMDEILEYAEGYPELRAVVLGPVAGDERLAQVFSARPWSYLPRNANGDDLDAAVTAVAQGLIVLHPSIASRLSPSIPTPLPNHISADSTDLSQREQEVLHLLALGLPNKTIAAQLTISEHTVKFHVASIMAKLGATSRTEAVRLGVRRGLVVL